MSQKSEAATGKTKYDLDAAVQQDLNSIRIKLDLSKSTKTLKDCRNWHMIEKAEV